jgi:DNA (cytosine-5)-methyltransferase 1
MVNVNLELLKKPQQLYNLNLLNDNKCSYDNKTYKIVDLFAGIGGIRLGFEKYGFNTIFSNDFDVNCSKTYNINFKTHLTVKDIAKVNILDIPDFDFLLGGFPCQAFSIAGYRKGFNDKRGNLFFNIAKILQSKKPAGFLLENVKNLKTHNNGKTFFIISETLKDLGYHVHYAILNTMEYGNIPQNRERIYIVGFRSKKQYDNFYFPKKIKLNTKISDLLEKNVNSKYYYKDKPLYQRIVNDIKEKNTFYQWRRKYVRKNMSGVCPTLTANMGMGGHNVPIILDNKGIRKLTPKECFNFQGFPSSYKLPNIADSILYKQAGNSVSVPVIERIAKQIKIAMS